MNFSRSSGLAERLAYAHQVLLEHARRIAGSFAALRDRKARAASRSNGSTDAAPAEQRERLPVPSASREIRADRTHMSDAPALARARSLLASPSAAPILEQIEREEMALRSSRRNELIVTRAAAQRDAAAAAPALVETLRAAERALADHDRQRESLVRKLQEADAAKSAAMRSFEVIVTRTERELAGLAPPWIAEFIEHCEELRRELYEARDVETRRGPDGREIVLRHNQKAVDAAVAQVATATDAARQLVFAPLSTMDIANRLEALDAELPSRADVAAAMVGVS